MSTAEKKTVPMPPDGCLWEAIHVAQYLGVSESWVYHEAAGETLPSILIGRFRRFDPDVIKAWAHGGQKSGKVVQLVGPR